MFLKNELRTKHEHLCDIKGEKAPKEAVYDMLEDKFELV